MTELAGVRAGGVARCVAVAIVAAAVASWAAPASAQVGVQAGARAGRPALRVTPTAERLAQVSRRARDAVAVIDSGDDADDRAGVLWGMYVSTLGDGEAALIRWALELQSVVRDRKGNYLHALCWVLNQSDRGRARRFADALARRGIAIGPDTGHYEDLAHLDPGEPIPDLPREVGEVPIGRYVDAFDDARYDLSYRRDGAERRGQLSKWLQVVYDDGAAVDIDIRLISDSYDPAGVQSVGRMYLGVAGRLYPLRMDRQSTPRLWAAKQAALAQMRRSNDEFEQVVTLATSGAMVPLGLAVPVQQPAPARVVPRPVTTRAPRVPRAGSRRAAVTPRAGHVGARSRSFGPRSVGAAQASVKLTPKARRILGSISHLKDITVRAAIRSRGGTATVVREAGDEFAGQLVGHVANAAANGHQRAYTVIKLIKDARRLGQQY